MVIIALTVIGLCLGSFVEALTWRLHEQSKTKDKKKLQKLSIVKGRSQCSRCGHKLAAKDLVPLLSWISLKGKCRYCRKPISWQAPALELISAALLVASYVWWPHIIDWSGLEVAIFGIWALLVTGFLALMVYDIRWYLLPDKIVFPLTVLGAVFVGLLAVQYESTAVIGGAAVGALTIFGLFYVLFQLSAGTWIGGGDVKLAILLGLLAGSFMKALLLLFIASVLGTIYGAVLGASGKQKLNRKLRIPFGPFLIIATFLVVLFGTNIVDWYSDLIVSV